MSGKSYIFKSDRDSLANPMTKEPTLANAKVIYMEGRKEIFYLTTHSTHFIYGYIASDIWYMTIQIVREETRCCHMGYSFRLTARVLLYAPTPRQDSTYHNLCYTSRGALASWRNSSMGPPHEGSIERKGIHHNIITSILKEYYFPARGRERKGFHHNIHTERILLSGPETIMGNEDL